MKCGSSTSVKSWQFPQLNELTPFIQEYALHKQTQLLSGAAPFICDVNYFIFIVAAHI